MLSHLLIKNQRTEIPHFFISRIKEIFSFYQELERSTFGRFACKELENYLSKKELKRNNSLMLDRTEIPHFFISRIRELENFLSKKELKRNNSLILDNRIIL